MNEQTPVTQYQPQIVTQQPPKRVVSLVPSMTETLFELGFGKQVVGVTSDCLYPADKVEDKFRVGAMDAVLVDDVVSLRPDLVIVNREDNTPEDIAALEEAGLMIWQTFPRTVLEAMNLIWDVLYTFQVDDRMLYERVNLINRTIDWVGAASETREDAGQVCRVFLPLLPDPLITPGADTYAHDLLKTAGGTNIFADLQPEPTSEDPAQDVNRYPKVSVEAVEAAQPDVIVLPGYPLPFGEVHVAWFGDLDVPAAHNDQIYLVDGSLVTYHGIRLARALNELSDLMCLTEEAM